MIFQSAELHKRAVMDGLTAGGDPVAPLTAPPPSSAAATTNNTTSTTNTTTTSSSSSPATAIAVDSFVPAPGVEDVLQVLSYLQYMRWCDVCLHLLRFPPSVTLLKRLITAAGHIKRQQPVPPSSMASSSSRQVVDEKIVKALSSFLTRATTWKSKTRKLFVQLKKATEMTSNSGNWTSIVSKLPPVIAEGATLPVTSRVKQNLSQIQEYLVNQQTSKAASKKAPEKKGRASNGNGGSNGNGNGDGSNGAYKTADGTGKESGATSNSSSCSGNGNGSSSSGGGGGVGRSEASTANNDTSTSATQSNRELSPRASPRAAAAAVKEKEALTAAKDVTLDSILSTALSTAYFSDEEDDVLGEGMKSGGSGSASASGAKEDGALSSASSSSSSCLDVQSFTYYFECLHSNFEGMAERHESLWPPQMSFAPYSPPR